MRSLYRKILDKKRTKYKVKIKQEDGNFADTNENGYLTYVLDLVSYYLKQGYTVIVEPKEE